MKALVLMDPEGRLTVPEAARAALQVEGVTQFELEVDGDVLILHPVAIPEEDAWAYTPEHLARVERARQQGRAGVTHTLTEAELDRKTTGQGQAWSRPLATATVRRSSLRSSSTILRA